METKEFTSQYRLVGETAAWSVFLLLVFYALITTLGFLSLKSPQDPIGDPFFSLMEVLILLIAPLMVINMIVVHAYTEKERKIYSFIALAFMIIMAGITSSVHFIIFIVSRQIEFSGFSWISLFFSFKWPSVAYILDILAWDFFFALSMLFASIVFHKGRLETTVRVLMIISGVLSLVGLIGVPLGNMHIRNIGIVGYALVTLLIFPLIGIIFRRSLTNT